MLQDVTLDAAIMSKVEQLMEAERGLDVFTDEELAEFRTQAQATYDEAYADLYDSLNDGEMTEDELMRRRWRSWRAMATRLTRWWSRPSPKRHTISSMPSSRRTCRSPTRT